MSNQDYSRVVFLRSCSPSHHRQRIFRNNHRPPGNPRRLRACDHRLVGSRDAARAGEQSRLPGWLAIPARHRGGGKLAGWRQSRSGVVPGAGTGARVGHIQQRLIGWSHSRASGRRLDPASMGLAAGVPRDRAARARLVNNLVAVLPRSRRGETRTRASRDFPVAPVPHTLRLELYVEQGFSRFGLVLLHFLVSRVPEKRPPLQHGIDRQTRLDSVPGGGSRQSSGRRNLQRAAEEKAIRSLWPGRAPCPALP